MSVPPLGILTNGLRRRQPVTQQTYTVTGMTCAHCTNAVNSEVSKIAGVESVDVDLATGHITVTGGGYSDEQIEAAVDEAGYALSEA